MYVESTGKYKIYEMASKARNPKIAHVFFLAGFIEAWWRGYEKIMREFDKANLKHPSFREEHGGVTAIIPREIFMSIRGGNNNSNANNGAKNSANGAKSGANDGANLTSRQSEIISIIKETPAISLGDMAKRLAIGTTTLDREIKKLNGIIRRVGPKNGGHWEIIES